MFTKYFLPQFQVNVCRLNLYTRNHRKTDWNWLLAIGYRWEEHPSNDLITLILYSCYRIPDWKQTPRFWEDYPIFGHGRHVFHIPHKCFNGASSPAEHGCEIRPRQKKVHRLQGPYRNQQGQCHVRAGECGRSHTPAEGHHMLRRWGGDQEHPGRIVEGGFTHEGSMARLRVHHHIRDPQNDPRCASGTQGPTQKEALIGTPKHPGIRLYSARSFQSR